MESEVGPHPLVPQQHFGSCPKDLHRSSPPPGGVVSCPSVDNVREDDSPTLHQLQKQGRSADSGFQEDEQHREEQVMAVDRGQSECLSSWSDRRPRDSSMEEVDREWASSSLLDGSPSTEVSVAVDTPPTAQVASAGQCVTAGRWAEDASVVDCVANRSSIEVTAVLPSSNDDDDPSLSGAESSEVGSADQSVTAGRQFHLEEDDRRVTSASSTAATDVASGELAVRSSSLRISTRGGIVRFSSLTGSDLRPNPSRPPDSGSEVSRLTGTVPPAAAATATSPMASSRTAVVVVTTGVEASLGGPPPVFHPPLPQSHPVPDTAPVAAVLVADGGGQPTRGSVEPRVVPAPAMAATPPASTEGYTASAPPPEVAEVAPPGSDRLVGGLGGEVEEERRKRVGGFWPHSPSALFASLACTLGPFSICRFSYLSFHYGGSFILQFLMLTVVFGLPLLSFQMSAGQFMGTGIMNMWKVSPVFYGVGISAIIAMAFQGIYNVIPISWMFVYFRDSFITNINFKWGECRNIYRLDECQRLPINQSDMLEKAIPAYFQNRVLQRQFYGPAGNNAVGSADLVFENVFNLAVIWMVTFICLSKGIKSYGKVVLAFGIFPMLSFYLLSIEILRRASSGAELILSSHTDMTSFFLNGWSWLAAAREVFFIWGLNGAALMQIASHNKLRHDVKRDCAIVILVTLSIVLLSAFLACACIHAIYKYDSYQHVYVPSSFETMESSRFLARRQLNKAKGINEYVATNYLLGVGLTEYREEVMTTMISISGYQTARFATEIYPAALVVLGPDRVSAFWPVLFYLCLITFGIAQQLAIWKCVIEGVIAIHPKKLRSWETSITFLACIFGFVLGLPFTTQLGILVVHFMDVCVGSAWWIMITYLVQIFALLLVRGRPYTSEEIVSVLTRSSLMKKWLSPVITFSWNIVLPIALLVVAITSFRLGDFGGIFSWENNSIYTLWPAWAKQIGALIQVLPILTIPVVSLIQVNRYLCKGQGDLLQRFESLIRPSPSSSSSSEEVSGATPQAVASQEPETPTPRDDPPPKYTPPPSYNTATGLKLLKRLNSFRRSLRRSQRTASRQANNQAAADVERQRISDVGGTAATRLQQISTVTTTQATTVVNPDTCPSSYINLGTVVSVPDGS